MPDLQPDCARCSALCCVLPPFARSADFPINKAACEACPNLEADFRCRIHDERLDRGFRGCVSFACFGAGQQLTQHTFRGMDWRQDPALLPLMSRVFGVMYALHGLLWHLGEALKLPLEPALLTAIGALQGRVTPLTELGPGALLGVDVAGLRAEANGLLHRASASVRTPQGKQARRRTWIGAKLEAADLRGHDLMGLAMLGADLRGADLRGADLRGTDLRGADLSGADLRGALFLTQGQLDSAKGDGRTQLDAPLRAPQGWAI